MLCSRVRPVITLATDGQYEETLDFSKSVLHFTDLVRSKDSWTYTDVNWFTTVSTGTNLNPRFY